MAAAAAALPQTTTAATDALLAGGQQGLERFGVDVPEVVDRDQGDRLAGERPDELAQLAVEARQEEVGEAVAGTQRERVGHGLLAIRR